MKQKQDVSRPGSITGPDCNTTPTNREATDNASGPAQPPNNEHDPSPAPKHK